MSGVISVGAAVGAAAIAATSVAEVGLTVGSALAIVGAVGATVGAIGKLTGNSTLGTVGMAMGAVGAIGGIAGMAGAFDGLGSAGSLSDIAQGTTAAETASPFSGDVIGSISGTTPPPDTALTGFSSGSFTATNQTSAQAMTEAPTPNNSLINQPGGGAMPAPPGGATAGTGLPGDATPTAGPYQSTIDPVTGAASTTVRAGTAQPVTPLNTTPAGSWSDIMGFIEKHPTLALSGISAASSFFSGAFNPKTPAEVNALNAQAARSQAEIGLIGAQQQQIQTQITNASQVPTATRTRTNKGTGLVNQPGAA